jgi:hypothetical protein
MKTGLSHFVASGLVTLLWVTICFVWLVGFSGDISWPAVFLFALYVYASFMLWWVALGRRIAPTELVFWLFHTNFLLLPALAQSMSHIFYWSPYDAYSEESLLFACVVITIGLLAFRAGSGVGRRKMRHISIEKTKAVSFSRILTPKWPVLIFLVSLLLVMSAFISMLGMDFFTSPRTSKVSQVDSLSEFGLFLALPRALGLGVLLVTVTMLIRQWKDNNKIPLGVLMIFVVAVGINAIVNYPLSVARFWFFGFVISLMWIVYPLATASLRALFILGMTIMQFTIFPLYSQITRDKGWIGGVDVESIRHYLFHGDFDGYQSIVNGLLYIQMNGLELGRNLVSVALFFVPRSFWENKALPFGVVAAQNMGYGYTNLSSPIYAELYADFGFVSLILGMFLIGMGVRLADGYYDYHIKSKRIGVGVLLTSTLAGYMIILLRGSLLGVVPSIATLLLVIIIAGWISKPKVYAYNNN